MATQANAKRITALDPIVLRRLREDFDRALAPVAEKYGLKITTGKATYLPALATFKMEVATIGADGTVESKDAVNFKRYAGMIGLSPDDLGKPVVLRGTKFTIAGFLPRSGRYPMLMRREDGKMFKFGEDDVRKALGKTLPTPTVTEFKGFATPMGGIPGLPTSLIEGIAAEKGERP